MKTTTLLLSIIFAAGSAQAVLDVKKLPATAPAELQDKLAWGLCTWNKQVVTEALAQGANPYEIEVIYSDYNRSVNAYKLAHDCVWSIPKYQPLADRMREESLNFEDYADVLYVHRMIFDMWELLIEKWVSVDKAEYGFIGDQPVRTFIQRMKENLQEQPPYKQCPWERELNAMAQMHLDRLQELIHKHQPCSFLLQIEPGKTR